MIHLGDVLEHLPEPVTMLRRLENLLAPCGVFFIEGPIEDNRSLVYACSRFFGALKFASGRNIFAEAPPTHLSRTNARSQRSFFEGRMGYEMRAFRVFETGWPYLNSDDAVRHQRGTAAAIRMTIGKWAVWTASVGRLLKLPLGNRFVAIASPRA